MRSTRARAARQSGRGRARAARQSGRGRARAARQSGRGSARAARQSGRGSARAARQSGRGRARAARQSGRGSAFGAAITLLLLAACDVPDFGAPRGATTQGKKIFGLWQGSIVAALAVGAVVWALIFFVIIRYRRRRNADDSVPSQRQYNLTLEILYTIVPLIIVAVLFYFTVQAQTKITRIAANPAVRVEVTGFQWGWRFHYSGTAVTVASQGTQRPVLTLPAGQTTRITLNSVDVIHSFYVPGFLFKRDAIPGLVSTFDLDPVQVGTFIGRCAEFCGLQHADMLFDVSVVSPDDYQRWLSTSARTVADTTPVPLPQPGLEGTIG